MTDYAVNDLRGRNVIDRSGTQIGTVDDVSIDPANWTVRGLVVNVKRDVADDLHLETRALGKTRLDVRPERVQTFGENVILNVDTQDIAASLRSERGTPT